MTPQPAAEPYVPQPGVIEQNEMFLYALKCAPNVAFSRFKQFGQVRYCWMQVYTGPQLTRHITLAGCPWMVCRIQ